MKTWSKIHWIEFFNDIKLIDAQLLIYGLYLYGEILFSYMYKDFLRYEMLRGTPEAQNCQSEMNWFNHQMYSTFNVKLQIDSFLLFVDSNSLNPNCIRSVLYSHLQRTTKKTRWMGIKSVTLKSNVPLTMWIAHKNGSVYSTYTTFSFILFF